MEAKDTVMDNSARKRATCSAKVCRDVVDEDNLLLAQAEISFKAGMQQEASNQRKTTVSLAELCLKHRKAGIKEVVELIDALIIGIDGCEFEERLDGDKGSIVIDMNENQWRAQKKEWGVK